MIGLLPVVMYAVRHFGEGEVGVKLEVGSLLSCDGSDGLRQPALGGARTHVGRGSRSKWCNLEWTV